MKNKKTPEKISIRLIETYCTMVVRESIELVIADYPELDGMSEEEIKSYINNNIDDMKSSNTVIFSSLRDELSQMDVMREKITDEDEEIHFD